MDIRAAWAERRRGWTEFERWRRTEDPARLTTGEEAVRWVGEILEYVTREHGVPEPARPRDESLRVLHERLSGRSPSA